MQVRDRLGELFPDSAFADAFGRAGRPGWSPGRPALVAVLQKAANLTDRQAADEVRENLSWKYALRLAPDDPGFDHSVLSEFRTRMVAHQLEEQVLDLPRWLKLATKIGAGSAPAQWRDEPLSRVAAARATRSRSPRRAVR